ncbi:MAG: HAMP domain-containing histidine kinase [Candidatus Sumerlaeia bacterium]|nr:HAMP domain-containing histidine kinase [Candidatus Sumerlaeia bacterium]
MWGNLHRSYLPLLSGLVFLFITGVVVVEIDRQIYQGKKKEICIANAKLITPRDQTESLFRAASGFFYWKDLVARNPAETSRAAPLIQDAFRVLDSETSRILLAPNSIVHIGIYAIRRENGRVVRERVLARDADKSKYRRCNTWTNSLVLKRFWGETARQFDSPESEQQIGEIVFRYTTPLNIPEITILTRQYWLLLASVVLLLSALYWYILRHLILPIKTVTNSVDRSKDALPEILPHPRTLLEKAYNNLARDALLNAVSGRMAEYMSLDRLVPREEIIGALPEMIAPRFGFAAVYAVELSFADPTQPVIQWSIAGLHPTLPADFSGPNEADWVELGRRFATEWSYRLWDMNPAGDDRRPFFAIAIAADRDQQRATFLAVAPLGPVNHDTLNWCRDTLVRLGNSIRTGLDTLEMQRDLIVREKSKAHISLSRALGHDLTNMIATSKLELDTVRRVLQLPPDRQMNMDPPLRQLFTESLHALLQNTRFLQEIINIYRSFSYVHHPQYERTDLNALVKETADLFRLSLSRRVELTLSLEEGLPCSWVEPRLLKLALFNLLTNATDSFKRRIVQEGDFAPVLRIATRADAAAQSVLISVCDNGLGIRNQRGEPASPEEIRAIFRGGYTTKREGMAEGLGLSWVRQIVCEFHQGQIQARNLPDGGAEVSLVLPLTQTAPDRNALEAQTPPHSGSESNPVPEGSCP